MLKEIDWGGEIIPVEADITLGFDIRTLAIDYTYYPWVKERWAGGFGLGFRVMDLKTTLTVEGTELEKQIDGAAPLPYINFEYRRIFRKRWILKAQAGWLAVKIGDIEGGQYLGRLAGEYITDRRWGFGAGDQLFHGQRRLGQYRRLRTRRICSMPGSNSTSTTSVFTSGFAGKTR